MRFHLIRFILCKQISFNLIISSSTLNPLNHNISSIGSTNHSNIDAKWIQLGFILNCPFSRKLQNIGQFSENIRKSQVKTGPKSARLIGVREIRKSANIGALIKYEGVTRRRRLAKPTWRCLIKNLAKPAWRLEVSK